MTMFFPIYRAASYNNPHEMFPSASKLFSGMTAAAGNVTKLNMAKSSTSMTVVNEGEEGNINLQTWKNSIILPTTFYYYGLFPKEIRQENDLAKICILQAYNIFCDIEKLLFSQDMYKDRRIEFFCYYHSFILQNRRKFSRTEWKISNTL